MHRSTRRATHLVARVVNSTGRQHQRPRMSECVKYVRVCCVCWFSFFTTNLRLGRCWVKTQMFNLGHLDRSSRLGSGLGSCPDLRENPNFGAKVRQLRRPPGSPAETSRDACRAASRSLAGSFVLCHNRDTVITALGTADVSSDAGRAWCSPASGPGAPWSTIGRVSFSRSTDVGTGHRGHALRSSRWRCVGLRGSRRRRRS